MSWVRMDDKRAMHPKLCEAGFAARGVDEAAIELCSSEETDGFIGDKRIALLATAHGESPKSMTALIGRLVDAGRWLRDDLRGGYWVKDYLHYNPSHKQLEAKREADRRRKQLQAESAADAQGFQDDSEWNLDGNVEESETPRARPQTGRDGEVALKKETASEMFDQFWEVFPRRTAKGAARAALAKAVKRAPFETILAGAIRFRDDPNRDGPMPHPSTWLNQDRWEDDPLPPRRVFGNHPGPSNSLSAIARTRGVQRLDG